MLPLVTRTYKQRKSNKLNRVQKPSLRTSNVPAQGERTPPMSMIPQTLHAGRQVVARFVMVLMFGLLGMAFTTVRGAGAHMAMSSGEGGILPVFVRLISAYTC